MTDPREAAIEAAADALRQAQGKTFRLLPWSRISAVQRKKWIAKATIAITTFEQSMWIIKPISLAELARSNPGSIPLDTDKSERG